MLYTVSSSWTVYWSMLSRSSSLGSGRAEDMSAVSFAEGGGLTAAGTVWGLGSQTIKTVKNTKPTRAAYHFQSAGSFMAASYRLGGGRYTRIGKLAERAEGIGAAIYASPLSNSAFTVAMFRAFSFFTSLIAQEGRGARSRPSGVPINAAGIRSPIASRINFRLGRK